MKILIIHNYYIQKGGEDRYVSLTMRLLKKFENEVILFSKICEFNYEIIKEI